MVVWCSMKLGIPSAWPALSQQAKQFQENLKNARMFLFTLGDIRQLQEEKMINIYRLHLATKRGFEELIKDQVVRFYEARG